MSTPEERNELASIIHQAVAGRGQKLYFSARYAAVNAILESDWLRRRERKAMATVLRQVHAGLSAKAAQVGCTSETVEILSLLESEMLALAGDLERLVQ
jgi:hypothetical protein